MPELTLDATVLEGVIFDVDGTLYSQGSLRRAMATRLLRAHLARPLLGLRTFRVLEAYRKAQEELRDTADSEYEDLADVQLRLACDRSGSPRAFVEPCVERWMQQEPLALLPVRIRPGLIDFVEMCRSRGLKLGVLSDYPAQAKLVALGLRETFDAVLSAQSPEIGVFKPNPRGLLVIAERLGIRPERCLYIGDRSGVDDVAAAAAGMHSCLISSAVGFDALRQALQLAQPVLDLR